MMSTLIDLALRLSASMELSLIAKATAILVLALAATRFVKDWRASLGHVVMASAFGALLVLPLVPLVLPPINVSMPMSKADTLPAGPSAAQPSDVAAQRAAPARSVVNGAAGGYRVPVEKTLWFVWTTGVLLLSIRIALAFRRLRHARRTGLPWLEIQSVVRELQVEAGLNRRVDLLLHEHIRVPMTCGVLPPTILFPIDAPTWSEPELRQALVHELEHVRRCDWVVQLLTRMVCALYWFHPLVWAAWRHMSLYAERACDDAVLRRADGPSYAAQLVNLAQRVSDDAAQPALSMASRSDLGARVSAILRRQQRRGRAGTFRTMAIVGGVAAILAMSPMRVVRALPQASEIGQSASGPTFDAASVKVNASGERELMRMQIQPGGRMILTNVPLRSMIRQAYRIQDFQIVGGPDWLGTDRFDITAKAEGNPDGDQMVLMLRALLKRRFKLTLHNETQQLPVFALIMARADGRLGAQMRKAGFDCAPLRNGPPTPQPPPGSARDAFNCGVRMGPGMITGRSSSMVTLASNLSTWVNRVVLDRTGLAGDFDLDLKWTPDQLPQGAPPPGAPNFPPVDPNGPSIFTAVQEQLGLKLESQAGPVDVLVIDRAERPTEN